MCVCVCLICPWRASSKSRTHNARNSTLMNGRPSPYTVSVEADKRCSDGHWFVARRIASQLPVYHIHYNTTCISRTLLYCVVYTGHGSPYTTCYRNKTPSLDTAPRGTRPPHPTLQAHYKSQSSMGPYLYRQTVIRRHSARWTCLWRAPNTPSVHPDGRARHLAA